LEAKVGKFDGCVQKKMMQLANLMTASKKKKMMTAHRTHTHINNKGGTGNDKKKVVVLRGRRPKNWSGPEHCKICDKFESSHHILYQLNTVIVMAPLLDLLSHGASWA